MAPGDLAASESMVAVLSMDGRRREQAQLLGQSINTVFAERYETPHLQVRSCIGSADDRLTGTSYYLAELQGVLRLVHDSADEAPHLFLRPGVSATRNALALLRLHGAPADMVKRALERAALLDRARVTTSPEP